MHTNYVSWQKAQPEDRWASIDHLSAFLERMAPLSKPLAGTRGLCLESFREPIGPRLAFHGLTNSDEYPEVLSIALNHVSDRLQGFVSSPERVPADLRRFSGDRTQMSQALAALSDLGAQNTSPWTHSDSAVARRRVVHYLQQFLPTALVDGCWLQGMLRVATVHTHVGAMLAAAYAEHVQAFIDDPEEHFVCEYRDVSRRLGMPVYDVCARSFSERDEFLDSSFELPRLLLSIGQFPRTFFYEIVGFHVGWQYLAIPSFSRRLVRDTRMLHSLPEIGERIAESTQQERARLFALDIARRVLEEAGESPDFWRRVWLGLALAADTWTTWLSTTGKTAPVGPSDPRQNMIDLLCRKAPHALGYHGDRRIGGVLIDEYFRAATFDPAALLDNLATSQHVSPGHPERSEFLQTFVMFGGPMQDVFSPAEIVTIHNWITSLARQPETSHDTGNPRTTTGPEMERTKETMQSRWPSLAFRKRSEQTYAGCSVRELYHHLVNLEFFPEILPVAERFAHDRLERSMLTIGTGERPIPAKSYDPDALERWVHAKHRAQVDSYRPLTGEPRISRSEFIESTVQLAPLILIDGGWLQGIATPALIHRRVGCMLFHVFFEELGEGDATRDHANIYRDLLTAMGESAPPVHTEEFANWTRLRDISFDVPTLWLSLSCFPRHFLPEILGLNLALEVAGLGGPYLEARDALRHFGFPTLFVDVHNAADNVSVGHTAWAMNAIKTYMDELLEREGPHNVDYYWHRVWSGVRATLPPVGITRMVFHRISARIGGLSEDRRVPLIFRT